MLTVWQNQVTDTAAAAWKGQGHPYDGGGGEEVLLAGDLIL